MTKLLPKYRKSQKQMNSGAYTYTKKGRGGYLLWSYQTSHKCTVVLICQATTKVIILTLLVGQKCDRIAAHVMAPAVM